MDDQPKSSGPSHKGTFGGQVLDNEIASLVQDWRDASINVREGVAILKGLVSSTETRDRILSLARQLPGVHEVDDRIVVEK